MNIYRVWLFSADVSSCGFQFLIIFRNFFFKLQFVFSICLSINSFSKAWKRIFCWIGDTYCFNWFIKIKWNCLARLVMYFWEGLQALKEFDMRNRLRMIWVLSFSGVKFSEINGIINITITVLLNIEEEGNTNAWWIFAVGFQSKKNQTYWSKRFPLVELARTIFIRMSIKKTLTVEKAISKPTSMCNVIEPKMTFPALQGRRFPTRNYDEFYCYFSH